MSEFTIDRLGAKGDGIAETPQGPVYLPFTLPGERVATTALGGRNEPDILAPSPDRREPPCPHFGTCGGCDLQHASDDLYRRFKRDLVVTALARAGVEAGVAPLTSCPPASRRRVTLSAVRAGGRVLIGYNAEKSNRIVAIETCPIALPAIQEALPALRRLASILIDRKRPLRLLVTATASGLDVAATDTARLNEVIRRDAVALSLDSNFVRLSASGEVLFQTRPPLVDFGGITVEPPPGAFLQAVAQSEAAMATLVTQHLADAKRSLDLFSGCGTFSLRLVQTSAVHAVEAEEAPLAAQTAAWRSASGLKPLTCERRDLFRRPVQAREMKGFDAVVFDPPRAGAEAVSRELAASSVRKIAAVSCNPVTLGRDLAILLAGGYRIVSVTPIDQFLWSHHVEAVALLER
ncbi:class I SAM-dependent RNA methyltransferase [Aurantimonas sp. VKM B-3413]|uniref:class I SAM-dependent RNA methyltransferase n=1 Tax=Aurantimonas sp. VKM B-3413 TaxID=2779401 RepID=UPI001E3DBDBC|nr:class I SAM-dependent RNA methyltransferase [Aurantimonas sp. VKM B-3413]MCB8838923.1 class I SAM-dependent RNA methyltransferase [Aurantimonas sp. VKM B-3413]